MIMREHTYQVEGVDGPVKKKKKCNEAFALDLKIGSGKAVVLKSGGK